MYVKVLIDEWWVDLCEWYLWVVLTIFMDDKNSGGSRSMLWQFHFGGGVSGPAWASFFSKLNSLNMEQIVKMAIWH